MKKNIIKIAAIAAVFLASAGKLYSQGTAINASGTAADPTAMLDVSAADKGVLIPRLALVSTTDPIAGTKPAGLLVYNTSTSGTYNTPGFYYWNGTDWQSMGQGDNLGNHTATQNLNMASYGITNLANPSAATDAVNAQTVQKGALVYAAATGADNYAVTLAPAVTAYVAGMVVNFKAASANTGAVTLNVNGIGAASVVKNGNIALVANDIKAGQVVTVIYDGTYFQMQSQAGNATTGGGGGGASDPTLIYTTDGF